MRKRGIVRKQAEPTEPPLQVEFDPNLVGAETVVVCDGGGVITCSAGTEGCSDGSTEGVCAPADGQQTITRCGGDRGIILCEAGTLGCSTGSEVGACAPLTPTPIPVPGTCQDASASSPGTVTLYQTEAVPAINGDCELNLDSGDLVCTFSGYCKTETVTEN